MPQHDSHILKEFMGNIYNMKNITEGYFHVPQEIYKDVKNYYLTAYKKVKLEGIKKITKKNLPSKNFIIDFTGTSYEHLNKLSPKPNVDVKLSISKGSHYNNINIDDNNGIIQLSLFEPAREVYDVIEHEMSHFVQFLIQKYNRDVKNIERSKIGGLPSKRHMKGQSSVMGYTNNGYKKAHSKRPVEYYPDLLSSIRELQYMYHKEHEDNWEQMEKSDPDKKDFLIRFFRSVKEKEPFGRVSSLAFKSFKSLSPEFYQNMSRILYDAFMNKPINFDPVEIKNALGGVTRELIRRSSSR